MTENLPEDVQAIVDQLIPIATTYGLSLVGAIVILIIGWMVAGWASRRTKGLIDRSDTIDNTLKPLFASLVRYTILAIVLIAVLGQFGVQTASIIAVLGAAGLAIGLSLQGALGNIASGVILLVLRPFNVGDFIDADGIAGTVTEIGLFRTRLTTPDGVYVDAPNTSVAGATIKNFNRLPTRRIDITIGIAYDDDINSAFQTMDGLMQAESRLLPDPAPMTMVTGLGDSAVDVTMRFWVKREDYWGVLFDLTKAGKEAFDKAGLSIPFPQQDLWIRQGSEDAA